MTVAEKYRSPLEHRTGYFGAVDWTGVRSLLDAQLHDHLVFRERSLWLAGDHGRRSEERSSQGQKRAIEDVKRRDALK